MTRQHTLRDQADQANQEAIEGGIDGGIRWFLGGVIVFGTAQLAWPFYRRLTPQFKVFTCTFGDTDRQAFLLSAGRIRRDWTDCSYCGWCGY